VSIFVYLKYSIAKTKPRLMAKHLQTGRQGEQLATAYLEQQGYEILHCNWRYGRAELDIVALEGRVLVIVEVKTRTSAQFGPPELFVSPRKKRFMAEAAACYMDRYGYDWELRFDIIAVLMISGQAPEIRQYRDAFFPGWG
jgi:putative endonuclease